MFGSNRTRTPPRKAQGRRQSARTDTILVCILPFAFSLAAGAQAPVAQRLVGAWELMNYEIIAADGTRRPGAYDRGQISYDASGRMSAHLMSSSNKADANGRVTQSLVWKRSMR